MILVEDVVRRFGYLTLGTRLKRVGERLQADTQKMIEAHGMPVQVSQFPFLAAVDRLDAPTVGDIAEAVGITQPGATRTIAQLCEAGLLETRPADGDQRRRIVSLSGRGRALVDDAKRRLWPRVAGAVAELCGDLDGPLLSQLAAIEDRLAAAPLEQRAERVK